MSDNSGRSIAFEGENITTTHWEDARHWMSIYAELIQFKLGLLDRVRRQLPKLKPIARRAAADDLVIIDNQLEGYRGRMDLWYERLWDLQGLWVDPEGRMIRHRGKEERLTKREFELLEFLLAHPHRFHTPTQIVVP